MYWENVQVVDLAMWLETSKMSPSLASDLLGGANSWVTCWRGWRQPKQQW